MSKDTQSEVAGAPPVINLIFVCASCTKPISSDDASVHHMYVLFYPFPPFPYFSVLLFVSFRCVIYIISGIGTGIGDA